MKQTLHIFAKDARRFWPEIAISIVITAAFVWIYPNQWLTPGHYAVFARGGFAALQELKVLANVLTVLVPVSWWLLIARVIHAESLVGDRQFWLTRPYEWKKLLAAKVMFLIVFLYLPFTTAQLVLLAEAGFQPFAYIPGLLFNLLLITGALVMPLFAVAVVTSNFARMALGVVIVVLGIIGIAVLSARLDTTSVSNPNSDRLSIPILLCVCGTAVAMEYAARRLWLARLLLLVLFLVIGAAAFVPSGGTALDRAYATRASKQDAPLQIAFLQDANHEVTGSPLDAEKQVQIDIPLQISGVADGYVIMPENVKVAVDAKNGIHWSSSWQAVYNIHYAPGTEESSVSFKMDRSVYEGAKSAPVALRLTFALAKVQAGETKRIPMSATDFFVPGFGVCTPEKGWFSGQSDFNGISCRSAFRDPVLTYVEALWSNDPCSTSETQPDNEVQGAAWAGGLDSDPAELGITSVWAASVSLSNGLQTTGDRNRPDKPRYLCPRAPLTFTRYSLVGRFQTEVVVPNLQLPADISRLSGLMSIQLRP